MRRFLAVGGRVWAGLVALAACGMASAQPPPALATGLDSLPLVGGGWTTEARLEDGSRCTLRLDVRHDFEGKRYWQGDDAHAVFGAARLRVMQDGREVAAFDGTFTIAPAVTFDPESRQVRRKPGEWFVWLTRDNTAYLRGTARFVGGRMAFTPDAESKVQADGGGSVEWTQGPRSFDPIR